MCKSVWASRFLQPDNNEGQVLNSPLLLERVYREGKRSIRHRCKIKGVRSEVDEVTARLKIDRGINTRIRRKQMPAPITRCHYYSTTKCDERKEFKILFYSANLYPAVLQCSLE